MKTGKSRDFRFFSGTDDGRRVRWRQTLQITAELKQLQQHKLRRRRRQIKKQTAIISCDENDGCATVGKQVRNISERERKRENTHQFKGLLIQLDTKEAFNLNRLRAVIQFFSAVQLRLHATVLIKSAVRKKRKEKKLLLLLLLLPRASRRTGSHTLRKKCCSCNRAPLVCYHSQNKYNVGEQVKSRGNC